MIKNNNKGKGDRESTQISCMVVINQNSQELEKEEKEEERRRGGCSTGTYFSLTARKRGKSQLSAYTFKKGRKIWLLP